MSTCLKCQGTAPADDQEGKRLVQTVALRSSRTPIPARLDGAGRCCKATAESALHIGLARMRTMTSLISAPARSGQTDSLPPPPGRPPKTGSRIGSGQGLPCRGAQQCRR